MTAEIAVINKSAVALAADSAITISFGSATRKIFETEDKLFELSLAQPIGIMIYDDLNFFETPLSVLVVRFRNLGLRFKTINECADRFRLFLHEFAIGSPPAVHERHLQAHLAPLIIEVRQNSDNQFNRFLQDETQLVTETRLPREIMKDILDSEISALRKKLTASQKLDLLTSNGPEQDVSFPDESAEILAHLVREILPAADPAQRTKLRNLLKKTVNRQYWSSATTGIVIAGFGDEDLFPTLISFELYGVINQTLRHSRQKICDIARDQPCAAIIPFAQQEMVGRFVSGIDDRMQTSIVTKFADLIEVYEGALADLLGGAELLQTTLDGPARQIKELIKRAIEDTIRQTGKRSKTEIEDMVRFMPKSEMANMAEALVNLTSIKRRVSPGSATVGGPIDVAVISRSEGFVWVKQKHYFPAALNPGYFARVNKSTVT